LRSGRTFEVVGGGIMGRSGVDGRRAGPQMEVGLLGIDEQGIALHRIGAADLVVDALEAVDEVVVYGDLRASDVVAYLPVAILAADVVANQDVVGVGQLDGDAAAPGVLRPAVVVGGVVDDADVV